MSHVEGITLLGTSGATKPTELLESFKRPELLQQVEMSSDEVTARCPVTGQPDQYTVKINYLPDKACIESKSLKLKLQSMREDGIFCESLSTLLCQHVVDSIDPKAVSVTIIQKPRGGVTITATSNYVRPEKVERV
jgi:7-cyano-7-deazaguanine reductase